LDATSRETPSVAFGLALAGGIIIIFAGLVVTVLGALVTYFIAGLGGIFGLIGVVWGVLIVVCAFMLRSRPEQHVGLGIAIILLSIFSWFGAFGGFAIGFLFSIIGGIMALAWNPQTGIAVTVTSSSVPAAATVNVSTTTKFCSNCGSPVEAGSKFCRNCGKNL
jgi:hypothetical protein